MIFANTIMFILGFFANSLKANPLQCRQIDRRHCRIKEGVVCVSRDDYMSWVEGRIIDAVQSVKSIMDFPSIDGRKIYNSLFERDEFGNLGQKEIE